MCSCNSGRSQRGRKRASRRCRPTPGVAPARAVLRTAGMQLIKCRVGWSVTQGCSTLPPAGTRPRLFREAPQLKTVATITHTVGTEMLCIEVQKHPVRSTDSGRPAIPAVADLYRPARVRVAVARGGHPNTPEPCPLKKRTPTGRKLIENRSKCPQKDGK